LGDELVGRPLERPRRVLEPAPQLGQQGGHAGSPPRRVGVRGRRHARPHRRRRNPPCPTPPGRGRTRGTGRVAAPGIGNDVTVPSPPLPVEVRRARRALEHYGEVRDRAEALLTIPSDTTPRAHLAGTARRPVVEPELWRLHVRYARTRDGATLTELVERYRPHAEAQARHAFRHGEPIDDLTHVAYEALVRALHRFRPSLRTPF